MLIEEMRDYLLHLEKVAKEMDRNRDASNADLDRIIVQLSQLSAENAHNVNLVRDGMEEGKTALTEHILTGMQRLRKDAEEMLSEIQLDIESIHRPIASETKDMLSRLIAEHGESLKLSAYATKISLEEVVEHLSKTSNEISVSTQERTSLMKEMDSSVQYTNGVLATWQSSLVAMIDASETTARKHLELAERAQEIMVQAAVLLNQSIEAKEARIVPSLSFITSKISNYVPKDAVIQMLSRQAIQLGIGESNSAYTADPCSDTHMHACRREAAIGFWPYRQTLHVASLVATSSCTEPVRVHL